MCKIKDIAILANKMEHSAFSEYATFDKWLLLIFQSQTLLSYNGTDYFAVSKNSVIIYPPNQLHAYKCDDVNFLNSFLIFSVEEEYFDRFEFPLHQVFTIDQNHAQQIIRSFDEISYILNTNIISEKKENIPDMINWVMQLLNTAYIISATDSSTQNTLMQLFSTIRDQMYNSPVKFTVKHMIECSNYSSVYFTKKYKRFFNITPIQDRKNQMVLLIKKYLETSNFTLEKIAELCNIESVSYLIHLFKEKTGITPHQYRTNHQKAQK